MLRWLHLVAFSLLAVASLADNVTFLRIDKSVVEQRVANAPATPEQRVIELRTMFQKAGCGKKDLVVQPVPDQPLPNVICTLPGTDYGTILIAAPLEYDTRGDENQVGWGGVAMLPLLFESMNSAIHRHTLVFAAFSGANHQGAESFWKSLSDTERREFRGMVALDHLGRTWPGFSAPSNADTMARILPAAARALRYPAEPRPVDQVPESDATFFRSVHVPAITIFSNGYTTIGEAAEPASTLQTVMPGTGHSQATDTSRTYALKTALDPALYNQTYNLLCVYVLFLDRGLGASKHPAPPVQVAKAEPLPTTNPAAAPPAAATTPASALATSAQAPVIIADAKSTPPAAPPIQTATNIPPAAPSPSEASAMPTIRVNTRLVQFDVVVTDKDGRPVKDLTASDFSVLQDGKPQSIAAFETHGPRNAASATNTSVPQPAKVAATRPANTFTNIPAKAPQNSWTIVLFDLLNTSVTDQSYARNQLLQLLKSLPEGQPVALFVLTRHLEMLQGFTQDPEQLLASAELLQTMHSQDLTTMAQRERDLGRIVATAQQASAAPSVPAQAGNVDTSSMAYGQAARIAQNYNDHEAFQNADRALFTLAAMKGMARAVSGYPGRKNLIWLSGSFPINIEPDPASDDPFRNVRDFESEIQTTSSLLATSRVAVYPVDVRGLQGKGIDIAMAQSETQFMNDPAPGASPRVIAPSASSLGNTLNEQTIGLINDRTTMKNIAQQTGGEAFINTNDLKRVIDRSLEDGSTYYTLAYTPPKENPDGGYHRVVVLVPNKNWKLAYRRGYYSIPPVTASGAAGTAALRAALQPGMPPSTSMGLTASVELPDAKRPEVK
ncbi:MAG TPA: VWA domain-containing protein, partial [Candidatus Bathyarchaeia archaeon]|nr:VWA domain-containing protein [Candidatus Bathyarchaeia archaeon]